MLFQGLKYVCSFKNFKTLEMNIEQKLLDSHNKAAVVCLTRLCAFAAAFSMLTRIVGGQLRHEFAIYRYKLTFHYHIW